ncbi:MAG: hypothetical protein JRI32_07155 [Deltaproteobacteria bacterium]|nr:hypothetical protein [Deltaproteobacteria bacterium]
MKQRLTDIISKVSWTKVKNSLIQNYPEQEESIAGYKTVFDKLTSIKPTSTKMKIFMELCIDKDAEQEQYIDVYGKNGTIRSDGEEEHYALDFSPWSEWLGMEVESSVIEKYTYAEIVSHCLYEMTFYGFDEETKEEQLEEIKRRSREFDNMTPEEREKHLVPWEKIKANILNKFSK